MSVTSVGFYHDIKETASTAGEASLTHLVSLVNCRTSPRYLLKLYSISLKAQHVATDTHSDMYSLTSLTAVALLAANIPITTANGQGMQPQALIAYRSSAGVNDTVKTIDYLIWNSNMTLTDISATEVWAAGGNAPATVNGYNCTFKPGGNPGGLHTVSYQGTHANVATNPVEIKWICCGGYATNASAPTASSAVSSSSTAIAPTGNSTSASNTSTTI